MRSFSVSHYGSSFIVRAFLVVALSLSAISAQAATWTGATADLNTAGNWTPSGVPGNSVVVDFTGSGNNNPTFAASFQGAGAGIGTMTLTSGQSSPLTITNAGAAGIVYRFGGGFGVTINSGAGALTFGDGAGAANGFFINMGNGTANFVNNSTNAATFTSDVQLNASGGTTPTAAFSGTGNWVHNGTITNNVTTVTKSGSGMLTLAGANSAYTGGVGISTGNTGIVRVTNTAGLGTGTTTFNGGTLELLNNGAGNNGTVTYGNALTTNSGSTATFFVNNNGANTGNTIAMGAYSIGTATVNVTGANGYGLSVGAMTTGAGAGTITLNPTTAKLTLASFTGNSSTKTLSLIGSATGNSITGAINNGSAAVSVSKNGTGDWALAGTSNYSGGTTIDGGTLRLDNTAGAGTGLIQIGNGTLSLFRSAATTTYANAITSVAATTGELTVDGSGTAMGTGTNSTYDTGTITVNGSLTVSRPTGGTGNTLFTGVLAGSGTLIVDNTNGGTNPVSGTSNGRANFSSASNTFNGAVTIQNGGNFLSNTVSPSYTTVSVGANSVLTVLTNGGASTTTIDTLNGSGTITKNNNVNTATIDVTQGTFSGVISQSLFGASGTVALTKSGAGTLTLSGANTYTGLTTIEGGTLTRGASNVLADGASVVVNNNGLFNSSAVGFTDTIANLTINSTAVNNLNGLNITGTLDITTSTHDLNSNASATAATVTMSGGSTIRLGANTNNSTFNIGAGGISMNTATLQLGSAGGAPTAQVTLGGNFTGSGTNSILANNNSGPRLLDLGAATRTFAITSGVTTVTATVQNGGLTKTGAGTLVLGGANTHSGTTTISAGTLQLTNSLALQNSAVTLVNSGTAATLQLRADSDTTFSSGLITVGTGNGAVNFDVGAANLGNTNHTLSLGNLRAGGTHTMTISNSTADGYTAAFGAFDTVNTQPTINTNTNASFTSIGASSTNRDNPLTFGGTATLTTGAINNDPVNLTRLTSVIKTGSGTLRITGASTYRGDTNLQNSNTGTVVANDTASFGGVGQVILNGGTLALHINGAGSNGVINMSNTNWLTNSNNTIAIDVANNGANTGNTINLPGNYNLGATTTMNVTGTNGYRLGIPQLQLGGGGAGTSTINPTSTSVTVGVVNNGGSAGHVLQLAGTSTGNIITGAINNGGGLSITKAGTGTWEIAGTSGHTGPTAINQGTLTLNGSIASSSLTTVASGATLNGTGTTGPLTISAGGFHKPGNSPGITTVMGNYIENGNLEIEFLDHFNAAGTGYDQVRVNSGGNVTLGGTATLTTPFLGGAGTFNPSFGQVFTLIDNQGAATTTTGIFSGLPAGSTITIDGKPLKIYYDDGANGNDVVLVSNNAMPAPITLYVDGDFTSPATVDGDRELAGSQTAFVNTNAFASPAAALAAYPSTNADIILNGGAYASALLAGGGNVTLRLVVDSVDNEPDVTIQSLSGDSGDAIQTRFHGVANGNLIVEQGSFAGTIFGAGNVTKTTSSTLTLSGPNTYTGTTTVSAGVLNIQNSTALGATTNGTTVASGAALELQGGIAVGAEALGLTGTGVGNNGALRNVSGSNSWAGLVTLGGATEIQSDAGLLTLTGGISAGANALTFDGAGNTTVSTNGVTGVGGNVTKNGSGTLLLSAANTYSGSTTVNTGTLQLTGVLQNSSVAVNGGTFLQSGGTNNVTGTGGNLDVAAGASYQLAGGTLDFGDYAAGGTAWTPADTSEINLATGNQFAFTGGSLQDVSAINVADASAFTQNGGNFYVGQNGVGPAAETTIDGGFSLLNGTLRLDVFGDDLTPDECCDGVPSNNDQLTVAGEALLDSAVSIDYVGGYEAEFGDVFTLICAEEITLEDGFFISGGFFRVVPTGDAEFPFALQAIVPEPASMAVWTLVGLAGAAGLVRVRRRR